MTTIQNLIKRNKHYPIRRLYIKRRDLTGAYEGAWYRIDNYKNRNRIISWGGNITSLDSDPQIIGAFEVSGTSIVVDNSEGFFNVETYNGSIWWSEPAAYLNRKYTKIKIVCGYLDDDGTELGVTDDFEGYIDSVTISEDYTATLNCLSYQGILQKYSVSDLSLTGSKTVNEIVATIMNQSKITTYLSYNAPASDYNFTVSDSSQLDGTYWDILTDLAFKSNSIIYLQGDTFEFKARTAGNLAWDFKGANSNAPQDIYEVLEYDDEGTGRIRVYFKAEGLALTAETSDTILSLKYKGEPEIVNIDFADAGDRQNILNGLLAEFQNPTPIILFSCKYLLNLVQILDKITIEIVGQIRPGAESGGFIWDAWTWDDGSVWSEELGGIVISSGQEWKVTSIEKNRDDFIMIIRAEKIT